MLKNKLSLVIEKFAGARSSGNWVGIADPASSPRSPFDFEARSPSPSQRGLKSYQLGGVGLGIVVEMEKSGEIISTTKAAFGQNLIHPNPVQVHEEIEEDDLEDYTFVTCHGQDMSYTRVYCDDNRKGIVLRKNHRVATFYISSPTNEDFTKYPPPDFLKLCHWCNKQLHDKDIYMYRGEQGFCSNECRYEKIMMDQRDVIVLNH